MQLPDTNPEDGTSNVIFLVFDAWSAQNTSLYGYQRETMPNLIRFAERATVYHNHLSTGTFTAPGAASLLTGLYPWSHRALHLRSGISAEHLEHNIFSTFHGSHRTAGYSQNKFADKFLYQMGESIDTHLPVGAFNIQKQSVYSLPIFKNDGEMAFASFEENIFHRVGDYDASLFLAPLFRVVTRYKRFLLNNNYTNSYPKGIPDSSELFLLEDLIDGTIETLKSLTQPSLLYMHYFPPHWPYQPKKGFFKKFRDGWVPDVKHFHPLSQSNVNEGVLVGSREKYDEYLASWDDEIGRLFDYFDESGLLERSYIVITSDHGEMFERGVNGHTTPLIYDPVARVPLIISSPGQTERIDIFENTSAVDILPTLAHLTGMAIPPWAEGELLPALGGIEDSNRSVYVLDAKENSAFAPLTQFSISMTQGRYRLTHYHYADYQGFEFYDLDADPEELNDLFPSQPAIALEMKKKLLDKIADINRPNAKS